MALTDRSAHPGVLNAPTGDRDTHPHVTAAIMILFLHHRYRSTGGEERAVGDLMWLVREHLGEDAELLERDSSRVPGPRRRRRSARRRSASRGGGASGAPHRRPDRARPQPASDARMALAGRCARRRRSGRPAPASVPAGVRDRGLLSRRRGMHALPRAQHAARRRAQLPRVTAPRHSPTAPGWRCGSGGWLAQVDAFVVPSRFAGDAAAASSAPRSTAPFVVPHVMPAEVAAASAVAGAAATRWSHRGWRPRRAWTSAIEACRVAGVRSSSPVTGPRRGGALERTARRTGGHARTGSPRVRFAAGSTKPSWRPAAPARASPSCRRGRPRRSGWPRPRRWPPDCRSPPRGSARCLSWCPMTGWRAPGDPGALAAVITRLRGDRAAGDASDRPRSRGHRAGDRRGRAGGGLRPRRSVSLSRPQTRLRSPPACSRRLRRDSTSAARTVYKSATSSIMRRVRDVTVRLSHCRRARGDRDVGMARSSPR